MNHHKSEADIQKELGEIGQAKLDPARFSVLYERYYKSIFIFIYNKVSDENLTADITQQTFLKAMLAIKKYEYKGVPFSAWLFRIALNEMNMYFRKSGKERVVSIDITDVSEIFSEETNDAVSEEDLKRKVAYLFENILPQEVYLLEMRFFEKKAFSEIGIILGTTENNAKVKTYRLLEKLRTLLKSFR